MTEQLKAKILELNIPFSENFTFDRTLGNPI